MKQIKNFNSNKFNCIDILFLINNNCICYKDV